MTGPKLSLTSMAIYAALPSKPYDGIACHIRERSGRFLPNALHGRKLYSFVGGGDPIRSSKSK